MRLADAGQTVLWVDPATEINQPPAPLALVVTDARGTYTVRMETAVAENGDIPLALRVHVSGETTAQEEILSDAERWTNEIRALAIQAGSGQVWVEKVRFDLLPLVSAKSIQKADGALGELLKLFDELQADPEATEELFKELQDLQRKLPRDLKMDIEGQDGGQGWLKGLLNQVQPMLVRRLLGKGFGNADR